MEELQAAQEKQEKEEPAKTEDPTKTGTTTGKTLADTAKAPAEETATTTTLPPLLPTTSTTTPSTTQPSSSGATTSAEDVKRAHGILDALGKSAPSIAEMDDSSAPTITVENSRIKIESGFFKSASGLTSLPGFDGVMLEDTLSPSGNFTETWAIYTDIETTRGVLEHYYNAQQVPGKPSEFEFESLDLDGTYTTTTNKTADLLSMSGVEATTTTGDKSYRKVNPTNSIFNTTTGVGIQRASGESFSATFRGVSGSFTCMSISDCTFTIKTKSLDHDSDDDTADIETLDGFMFTKSDWIFKAGSQPQIAIPGGDLEFMYFGWWLRTPDSARGTYVFEPKLGGMRLTDAPIFIGTARYTGPATGMYVKQNRADTVESDGELLTVASSGVFTADATLVASASDVSGSVRNFKEGGQSLGDWTVRLNDDDDDTTALQVGNLTQAMAGKWDVEFVPSRVGGDGPSSTGTAENPVAAVGYFNAEIADVLHLSGAFGAERQSPK